MQVVFITIVKAYEKPLQDFPECASQVDLVRNYIAMKLPADRQEKIFYKYWAALIIRYVEVVSFPHCATI